MAGGAANAGPPEQPKWFGSLGELVSEKETTMAKTPTELEQEAVSAMDRGDWKEAAKSYREAAGACVGAKRAEFYEKRAEICDNALKTDRPLFAAVGSDGLREVVWGVGETEEAARKDAARWIGEAYGPHGEAAGLDVQRAER